MIIRKCITAIVSFLAVTCTVVAMPVIQEIEVESDSLDAVRFSDYAVELFNRQEFDSAFTLFEESSSLATYLNLKGVLGSNSHYQARIMEELGDWQLALRYYLKALSNYSGAGDSRGEAIVNSHLSERYFEFGL